MGDKSTSSGLLLYALAAVVALFAAGSVSIDWQVGVFLLLALVLFASVIPMLWVLNETSLLDDPSVNPNPTSWDVLRAKVARFVGQGIVSGQEFQLKDAKVAYRLLGRVLLALLTLVVLIAWL